MKKLLLLSLFAFFSCNKDDDSIKNYGKIEYRVLSEYPNDNLRVEYSASDGTPIRDIYIKPPFSIVFETYNHDFARVEGWRPSLSSGDITVEIYLNDVLVDSETEGRATYVANAYYSFE